ncbi:MAG: bifunctional diaminohydroxyphosphoribosylaminopyrimidine deaminase/5-amino-6-(5-phosphoribosylamino)uracil reductase RibD [Firmicutes bacterium]|jgi:diaminohydroxyphosphoribosylaminopyrimidine deaminase/5-amino-6-(5-phosphoribosylamino)uracil reductase|nr:bifunctional diaminohydroxyphosphoribosylaminopyrimidine deaminase/5-amino-6-(5-phosphoribosylamino)uracil reductase RibD [Bacillota bacterium]
MDPDERYMWMALDLARRSCGKTNPNPMVGAVIVKGGEVVGTGFHKKAGDQHAEIVALSEAGDKARHATLYTNLEPCSHQGRTPPCTEAILHAGIRRVVLSMVDPNPLVSGQGIRKLKEAGIKVKVGVLEEKARRLNEIFIKYITTKMPFVMVKAAMSLDGKIATTTGESRWISGEKSRKFAHHLRAASDGIMVGINTILRDDPLLTVRLGDEGVANPARIIVDSRGRMPLNSKVVKTARETKTILATTELAAPEKIDTYQEAGVEVLVLPSRGEQVDLQELLLALGEKEISALLVEGGGTLNYSFLNEGLIDKVYFFIAPFLLGGEKAPTPVGGAGIYKLKESWKVQDLELKQLDDDLLIIGYPVRREEVVYRDSGGIGGDIRSATGQR